MEWAEEPTGIPALFVGGRLDGQVLRIRDFRENATPDGYCAVETWGQVNGVWGRLDERGKPPGTTHRMEVAFAVGEPWTNARIMQSMAGGLGAMFTYGQKQER